MLVTEMLSSYLTKDDFPTPALGTIARLEQQTFTGDTGSETKWICHLEEFDRGLVLNKTNIRLIAAFLGNDTAAWMGRKIVIYNDPMVSFGGRTVGGIRVRAPKGAPAPSPAVADLTDDIPF